MTNLRQCWRTPDDFWGVVNAEFAFDIDVAADSQNHKCPAYISEDQNALELPWFDGCCNVAWCNPGFTAMQPWIQRAAHQAQCPGQIACVLGLCAPSTAWWSMAVDLADEIRLLAPRIQFDPPPGIKRSSNARDNALFIFRKGPTRKAHIWTWRWK
jgi:phage N-6-adenine-methyltransferase